MSTITKEHVRERLTYLEGLNARGVGTKVSSQQFEIACLRKLLASLEAEPVAYIIQDADARSRGEKGILRYFANISDEDINEYQITVTPLYTAPPAPVVPDMAAVGEMPFLGTQEKAFVSGWNACRAAMLQGANGKTDEGIFVSKSSEMSVSGITIGESQCRNSPVIPDCSCRTCRPVTFADSRFVVCPVCGNKRCPHANDHRNACTGSNEPGQEGSAYPAVPQQEAKNV